MGKYQKEKEIHLHFAKKGKIVGNSFKKTLFVYLLFFQTLSNMQQKSF